jgi:hypothetical protein
LLIESVRVGDEQIAEMEVVNGDFVGFLSQRQLCQSTDGYPSVCLTHPMSGRLRF